MIDELKSKIIEANDSYRLGNPIMPDSKYDDLIDRLRELSPNDELLNKTGHEIEDTNRKVKLPISMASMNKIKTKDDIDKWIKSKNILPSTMVILTPKFDGLSLCVDEIDKKAYTRGDGVIGQRSDKHYEYISNKLKSNEDSFQYTYGEVMIKKSVFLEKFSDEFANPRNLVAGLLNSKTPSEYLKDCEYIKYGIEKEIKPTFQSKKQILDLLNRQQPIKVNYKVCRISDLTEELMIDLFSEWSKDFEIDGIIIEINDLNSQRVLGRETSSNNPVFARAFKHKSFEQTATSRVLGITWNVSKNGLVKPIININPVRLDGVTVSNITGNNARFIKEMGIGKDALIKLKRSGMVIPLVVDVLERVDFKIPIIENTTLEWNENGIELITTNETDTQKVKKIIAFFEILGAENISSGVIQQLWNAGYQTIKDILSLSKEDLLKIDRFGKRKADIVLNSIKTAVTDVRLSKLQHATGLFNMLGSKKLALLEHFENKPSIDEVKSIEGFADKSAEIYVNNYDKFFKFIKDLPITISKNEKVEPESNDLEGMVVVFTGVRDKSLEEVIISRGGDVRGSVSKKTTHLVMKKKGSGSSKENKAIDLGIEILEIGELEKILTSN
mgnify:CR=1 FL=1